MPKILFSKDNQPDRKHPPFSSTNQPANRGRKPRLANLPPDAREEITKVLWHALTLPDRQTAQDYLNRAAADLPKYGCLIQVYARGLLSKNGADVADQILDRLFGKPKQTTEMNVGSAAGSAIQITVGSQKTADALRKVLATGAQPRDPETPED